FIGLGRSSLSSTSLSATYLSIKEKITEWKPDVIQLWKFPKSISDYKIDTEKNLFSFSGSHFKLPLLLSVTPGKIEPKLDTWLATPLKQQLAKFAPDEKFVWIDRCYKIGSVWDDKLAMDNGLCVANGTLNAAPVISRVQPGNTPGKIVFPAKAGTAQSDEQYQRSITRLKIADTDLKYRSDTVLFNLPGLPQQVQKVSG
ncbi:MAG TPA: phosphoglycerol transferase I, partial [Erwinia persicina]|nr:phosphoglycerol transferase I [Erwinia persicina]